MRMLRITRWDYHFTVKCGEQPQTRCVIDKYRDVTAAPSSALCIASQPYCLLKRRDLLCNVSSTYGHYLRTFCVCWIDYAVSLANTLILANPQISTEARRQHLRFTKRFHCPLHTNAGSQGMLSEYPCVGCLNKEWWIHVWGHSNRSTECQRMRTTPSFTTSILLRLPS